LVALVLTYLFLLMSLFLLYVPLMGHPVSTYWRDVIVSAFAISAHMLAERFARRLRLVLRSNPLTERDRVVPESIGRPVATRPRPVDPVTGTSDETV